ncbi:MAG: Asp-tRNA(Asn)/Glu-tRNA(Gln) amidotransferase subunit GatB, partial [Planctomycetota bacterium]
RIRRAHLEEDAGKLLHDAPGGYAIDYSIVDLNRAGTPLLEIVTEPDFDSPESVGAFARDLQRLVQYLGVSHGQMQMGHMRFEPNINVHITDEAGEVHKTAITEVKNLNSFSVVEKSVAYEVKRQVRVWEETGDLGKKATYGWDDAKQQTFLQREKEEAHDYRYFPDPDLMPVEVDEGWLTELKGRIGELPAARLKRYREALGLNDQVAADLSQHKPIGDLFDGAVDAGAEPKRAAALVETLREVANEKNESFEAVALPASRVAEVAKLVQENKIQASKETGRRVLESLMEKDQPAETAAESLGLIQSTDTGAIDEAIDAMLAENPKPLQQYRDGKKAAFGALVGNVMKRGKGLNPKLVKERLEAKL